MRAYCTLPLCILLAGCADLLPPPGVDPYEFRDFGVGGNETPLSFHWPRSALPVTIHIEPGSPLATSVQNALDTWQGAFIYGELRFALTADSTRADIIVRNEAPTKGVAGLEMSGGGDGCFGYTDLDIDRSTGTLQLPVRVRISTRTLPTNPGLQACYDATVLHEFGHAVGILAHSSDPNDVMYVSPARNTLSARDRATIEAAYHLPANVTPRR